MADQNPSLEERKKIFLEKFNALVDEQKITIGTQLKYTIDGITPEFTLIDKAEKPADQPKTEPAKETEILTP